MRTVSGSQQGGVARSRFTRRRAALLAGAVVVVVAAVVAATTIWRHVSSPGPLDNGSQPGGTGYAGISVNPGQVADFSVTVRNSGSSAVTLERAALLPVPGLRAPRLVHVAVLVEHAELITSARGWPIPRGSDPTSGYWLTHPLRGYVVLPWQTRRSRHLGPLPDMIVYGVSGPLPDRDYASAGLLVTYRIGSATYSQRLYNGGDACVLTGNLDDQAVRQARYNRYCAATDRKAIHAVVRLAANGSS